MAKRQRTWVYSPKSSRAKPKVPDTVKAEVEKKGAELVESVLKPEHIKPPPQDPQFNYLVDIFVKWHGNYFYFCATYHCPDPHAISPSFELKFARLEYTGRDAFSLSYMRHTGKWWEIASGLSLDECFTSIQEMPHFNP